VGHKPKADFVSTFDSICASQTIEFQNTSTNGPITFLQWNYGKILDSATGQYYLLNPLDTGYLEVTLVAFNYGCTDTITKNKEVYVLPPIAKMDFLMHCDNKQSSEFF
jgi:PKD repeat protein